MEDVVQKKLDNLDPDAMALAEYASCIGRLFDYKAAMSVQTVSNPEEVLNKLQNAGIVIIDNDAVEFCHAIFQDVIYKGIGDRWKSSHHLSLGEYYEAAYSSSIDDVLYDLAKHFSRSIKHEKGYEYCYRAGEKAENIFALEQAIKFYIDSLNLLSKAKSIDDYQGKTLDLLERKIGRAHV